MDPDLTGSYEVDRKFTEITGVTQSCEDLIYYTNSDCLTLLNQDSRPGDCIIETKNFTSDDSSVSLVRIIGDSISNSGDINFYPPSPITNLHADSGSVHSLQIELKNNDNSTRSLFVNSSGLINVE